MSATDLTRLLNLRDAGAVVRYHTARMQRSQNLAEHSYGVAMIILHVSPHCSKRVLEAALYHDLSEAATGDLPAPAKWNNPALGHVLSEIERQYDRTHGLDIDLNDTERHLLKWADMFELVLWCREEYKLGNQYARTIMDRGINYLQNELGPCSPEAAQLLFKLIQGVKE